MHGDAAPSNRKQTAYQGLQLLESVSADIIGEEYEMDVLSRLSLLQHKMINMRRNADSARNCKRDARSKVSIA